MPLVSSAIANLVGGLSQQPASMRLPTMGEWLFNCWPSIVSGLQKRPPTRHIANLGVQLSPGSTGHIIDRDPNYRYLVVAQAGDIKVVDLNTGALQTVNFPNGKNYLSSPNLPVDTFRFVTLGDFTFICNRTKVVQATAVAEDPTQMGNGGPINGQKRVDPSHQATFYVTQANYNTYYSLYVNGVLKASYLTPPGTSGSAACPDTGQIATELNNQLRAAGYTTLQTGSSITITNFDPSWTIQTQGGSGDKMVRGFIQDAQSFSDLMPVMFDGRIFRIAADMTSQDDDYFVVYQKGVWIETMSYGTGETLDLTTMPHVLVRETNGTWTFKPHSWRGRQVGDASSSKTPSFVGYTINDIFTFTNRFGILADENVILSEAGNYENFYRTSAAQLLDSDPIDIAVLHNNVDILYHCVPYNRDLLLMSEKDQFRLTFQNYLGQKTTRVEYTSSFNVSKRTKPYNVGNSVYFVDDRPDYVFAKLFEFYPKDNSTVDDADEVTAPIPEVVPADVDFMAASNRSKTIVMHSPSNPTRLYVYKFFWSDDKKVQNAWGVWEFQDCTKIYWADFNGNFLYLLTDRNGSTHLERIRTDEDVWNTDEDFEVMLDRRVSIPDGSIAYDPATDTSVITLPYPTSSTPEVILKDIPHGITGFRPGTRLIDPTHLRVDGDCRGYDVLAGVPYVMEFEFSTIYMRQRNAGGGYQLIQDGRLQLRYLTLEYHDTSYFDVHVTLPGRDPYTTKFSGQILGSENQIGRQPVATGKLRVPVMSENLKARITITNDTPFPSAFGAVEWQGVYSPKSATRVQ